MVFWINGWTDGWIYQWLAEWMDGLLNYWLWLWLLQWLCVGIAAIISSSEVINSKVTAASILTATAVTVSVLGRYEGYTVKYNPLPEGVPEGEVRGYSRRQRVIFDRISRVES